MGWALMEEGFHVAAVRDAGEALERMESFQPDVVVFNTELAEEAKAAAIALLRAQAPAIRIVDIAPEGREPKTMADAYLRSPLRVDSLVELIRSWIV